VSNTADYIKREAEEIAGRTGRYIPPYRMANLMKSAQRITDLMVKTDLAMTYEECVIVLNIVQSTIRAITGKEIV
jgi:hypothetical protein